MLELAHADKTKILKSIMSWAANSVDSFIKKYLVIRIGWFRVDPKTTVVDLLKA